MDRINVAEQLHYWLMILSIILITGCGGDGGGAGVGGNTPSEPSSTDDISVNTDDLIEISENELGDLQSEGVWISTFQMEGSLTTSYEAMIIEIIFNEYKSTSSIAYKLIDDITYVDSCDIGGYIIEDEDSTDTDDYNLDFLTSMCEDHTANYYKSPDGLSYYLVLSCEGIGEIISRLTKIDDASEFDMGTASITFKNYPDVTADTGICGSTSLVDQNTEYSDLTGASLGENEVKEYQIALRVPYQDDYLYLEFTFAEKPKAGKFELTSEEELAGSGKARLLVLSGSESLGASADDVLSYVSNSGSLTLTHIENKAFDGEFNANIGIDTISGSFSVLLE